MSAYLSNRRQADPATDLIHANVLMSLGHVGVALNDVPKATQTILHQCLLRSLCNPPSKMDLLIVDQLACLLLAHKDGPIHDAIMEQVCGHYYIVDMMGL